jgi:hypothetical protein
MSLRDENSRDLVRTLQKIDERLARLEESNRVDAPGYRLRQDAAGNLIAVSVNAPFTVTILAVP